MSRKLDEIYAAIARMPGDDGEKSQMRERARRYHRACGCALAGAFLTLAILASLIGLVLADPFRWSLIPVCLAGSIAAAVAGKAIGIGWGKARLSYLHRSLVRRIAI